MKKFLLILASLAAVLPLLAAPVQDEARLLRFPAVGGGKIVFCYAGDLYRADINGGAAVKLTADVGYEGSRRSRRTARLSPSRRSTTATPRYTPSRSRAVNPSA